MTGVILIVDDNEQNRALARATLEEEGYVVELANSGEEALRVVGQRPVDCVLLDVRMPKMDGFSVCRNIRERPQGADIPVIFLTALRDVDTFDAALRAGGDDFLTKPVMPSELVLRVQAALRLRRLNASNREYHELVRHQRDALMRLQLQKERLTAFVVHDLKNPVSTVDLHAQLLLRDPTLPEHVREAAASIREEVGSLMRLILNLLDISKSEEGKLSPTLVNLELNSLVNQVFEALSVRASERQVAFESDVAATELRADVDLLRRVLENLLENALRHAPRNSRVRVTGRAVGGAFELRIADQGCGVPAELRESIFERFVQVETQHSAVSRSGRGLGLAFCRLAVEAHAGRIWVEDAAPGAIFCVSLPHGD